MEEIKSVVDKYGCKVLYKYKDGQLHSDQGPAITYFSKDGNPEFLAYYIMGSFIKKNHISGCSGESCGLCMCYSMGC